MKRIIIISLLFVLLLLSATKIEAFDGNRKGFVLSGGVQLLNISTSGKFKNLYYPGDRVLTVGFSLGYAFNNKNILAYDRRIMFFDIDNTFQTVGLSWSHYFSAQKKSFFTRIGIRNNPEALLFGGGYMFSNNLQFNLTYERILDFENVNGLNLFFSYAAF